MTEDITFSGINKPRTLKCNVEGEPNTFNFTWSHVTYNNQLVRMFHNTSDGVLKLPEGEVNDLVFEDSGFYFCNVTNGISDDTGKLWQSGKIKVMIEGNIKPDFNFESLSRIIKNKELFHYYDA